MQTCILVSNDGSIAEVILDISTYFSYEDDLNEDYFEGEPRPFIYRCIQCNDCPIYGNNMLSWHKINNNLFVMYIRPRNWRITDCLVLEKLYPGSNAKAIQINKRHKIWGPAVFWQRNIDMSRQSFINNQLKGSVLAPVNLPANFGIPDTEIPTSEQERYKIAQIYLKALVNHNIATYEDAYVLMGSQIRQQYVKNNLPWYNSGPSFHSRQAKANMILRLDLGTHIPDNRQEHADYLWEPQTIYQVLPENFELFQQIMEQYCERKSIPYEIPAITPETEEADRERIAATIRGRRRRRRH